MLLQGSFCYGWLKTKSIQIYLQTNRIFSNSIHMAVIWHTCQVSPGNIVFAPQGMSEVVGYDIIVLKEISR